MLMSFVIQQKKAKKAASEKIAKNDVVAEYVAQKPEDKKKRDAIPITAAEKKNKKISINELELMYQLFLDKILYILRCYLLSI